MADASAAIRSNAVCAASAADATLSAADCTEDAAAAFSETSAADADAAAAIIALPSRSAARLVSNWSTTYRLVFDCSVVVLKKNKVINNRIK